MQPSRIVRILSGSLLAATLAFASWPASAATASTGGTAVAPPVAPAASNVAFDPAPPMPPWVFSGHAFTSQSACAATGRAYVNSGTYQDYTCRYQGGLYRLYLLPGLVCFSADLATLPSRGVAFCP
jgi:hypothetical protein